jgi:Fibronectin type III domain.
LQHLNTSTNPSESLFQTAGDKDTFKVENLTPKKKYKIRVKAVNKEGESEPLETEEAIVAKNPYGESYHSNMYCKRRWKILVG